MKSTEFPKQKGFKPKKGEGPTPGTPTVKVRIFFQKGEDTKTKA